MARTVEAIIDQNGNVKLLEFVHLPASCRAFVTILEESPVVLETALLSETALAADWLRLEEDKAWSHLQSGQ